MVARWISICVVTCFIVGVITLAGCGGKSAQSPATQPVATSVDAPDGFSLISPAEVFRLPSAVEDTARYCKGEYYDWTLPHQNIDNEDGHSASAGNPYTNFEPAWDPAAPDPADLAYCIYRLGDLTGYSASRELRFGWTTPPTDWGDFWVGVANIDHNRWDWFQGPQYPAVLTLGGLAPYISGEGEMLVIVLFTGNGCPTLDWVLLGATIFEVDFEGTPQNGLPPLTVDFTVDAESTVGGYPVSYDFDFDGGGLDEEGNLTGITSFEYTVPGTYHAMVGVILDNGEEVFKVFDVIVVNPANTAPLAALLPVTSIGAAALTIEFNASGSHDTDGGSIIKYEWDFEMDGVYDRDTGSSPTTSYTFGKAGVNNVVVRVTDNDLATATDAVLVNVTTGWHINVLDTDARLTDNPSLSQSGVLLMPGPKPNVAYRAYGTGLENAVRFIRGGDTEGKTWGAPLNVVTGTGAGYGVALNYYTSGMLNLYPSLTYGTSSGVDSDVFYIGAMVTSGATWYTPQQLNTTESCGSENAIGRAGGNPVVLSERSGTLYSVRATTEDGSAWGSLVTVHDVASVMGFLSTPNYLRTTCGATTLPHAGFRVTDGESAVSEILLCSAVDQECTGWGAPVVVVDNLSQATAYKACSFAVINDRLAVAYHDGYPAQLYYCRANDAAATDWGVPVLVDDTGYRGYSACLVWWEDQGFPVICYYDWAEQNLMAVQGMDYGATWKAPMVIDSSGDQGRHLTLRICDDVPVVMYSDHTNSDLKTAAWY